MKTVAYRTQPSFFTTFCLDKALDYICIGCYYDFKDKRILPELLANLRSKIDWHNPKATIDECAILASQRKKTIFSIQYYGECMSYEDNESPGDYTQHGESKHFWAGLGGEWTNCVYEFV